MRYFVTVKSVTFTTLVEI